MNQKEKYILGIDISKRSFDVALLLPNGKRKNKKFSNDTVGFNALYDWLGEFNVELLHACMEATNVYGNAWQNFCSITDMRSALLILQELKGLHKANY